MRIFDRILVLPQREIVKRQAVGNLEGLGYKAALQQSDQVA